jgi:hypothetical protein
VPWHFETFLHGVLTKRDKLGDHWFIRSKYDKFFIVKHIHRSEILSWAQKNILYGVWNATGSHEGPKTWNSNKSCNKNLFSVKKLLLVVFIWNWKSFLQLFSKLILKHVIRFMNKKSSCGYATHFFFILLKYTIINFDCKTKFKKKSVASYVV